jgi:uncharacterized membrane protein
MSANEIVEVLHKVIELAALLIELLAVAVIIAAVVVLAVKRGTVRYVYQASVPGAYESYKHQLGKALLLGLELLVAADVVRTVALEPTLKNVAVLGLLVLIRTFLSWSLSVEMDGRWPWQSRPAANGPGGNEKADPAREAGDSIKPGV